jgi:hypothetical protein
MVPAWVFPDVIYVRPGKGGNGGAAATDGVSGTTTYVAVAPDTGAVAFSLVQVAGGSNGAAVGTAGSAGSAATAAAFASFAVFVGMAGQAGTAGGANTGAVGTSLNPSSTIILSGGAGGAGSSTGNTVFAGGAINSNQPATGISLWSGIPAGAAGVSGSQAGGNGNPGQNHGVPILQMLSRNQPMLFSGGSGGGSGGASNGGNGGPGAWGCGGGGGGAGATGGAGGKGGDGFVIIGAF